MEYYGLRAGSRVLFFSLSSLLLAPCSMLLNPVFHSSLRSRSYFGGVGHSTIPLFQSTLRSSTATEDGLRSEAELRSSHHVAHRFLQTIQRQLKHGKNLPNNVDSTGVWPFHCRLRIEPNGAREGFGYKLEHFVTWPS